MLCGGLWGLCLYLFVAAAGSVIPSTTPALALLTIIPAAYAGLGALLTRRIGFNPLVLGLGWVLVEVALKPLGLRSGLLAGTQAGGTLVYWVGQVLGYVLVAFLVAYVNASLLAVLTCARLSVFRQKSLAELPDPWAHPALPRFWFVPLLAPRQAYPRVPPNY